MSSACVTDATLAENSLAGFHLFVTHCVHVRRYGVPGKSPDSTMSNYALYCQIQAAQCARRARLAISPEVIAHFRELGLSQARPKGVRRKDSRPGRKERADGADPRRARAAKGGNYLLTIV